MQKQVDARESKVHTIRSIPHFSGNYNSSFTAELHTRKSEYSFTAYSFHFKT